MESSLKEMNGRHYMPAKVVMLSTNEATGICTDKRSVSHPSLLLYHKPTWQDNLAAIDGYSQNYHLYFTSNEEIKNGDWVLMPDNTIHKMSPSDMIGYLDSQSKATKKIIATTDTSLGLSQPSQSFIKAYIEEYNKGNVITDVLVEYIVIDEFTTDGDWEKYRNIQLKVDLNNTITIKKVKDSWSIEELCLDMQYYMEYCKSNEYITPQDWLSNHKHY